jgi:hypothetical protein
MKSTTALPVDRDQIEQFVDALFRHADKGTYASMRTFLELEDGPPVDIRAIKLNGDPTALAKAMIGRAQLAADYEKPCVFAPPVSTFSNARQARESDLANGLALSVELDADAARSRQRLEFLLATPATVVVASGGDWSDPQTGEIQDKLHLHWRLKEPTRTPEAHAKLKQARTIATQLVGGDCTNTPAVHPIRMPGSWHRKAEPKLARIVAINPEAEIDLHAALGILLDIQPEFRGGASGDRVDPGEERETAELIRRVTTGEEYHAALRDLSWRYLMAGMAPAQVVLTLRGLMDASTGPHDARWQHRRDQIPKLVSSAEAKLANQEPHPAADLIDEIHAGNTKRMPPFSQEKTVLTPVLRMFIACSGPRSNGGSLSMRWAASSRSTINASTALSSPRLPTGAMSNVFASAARQSAR